MVRQIEQWLRQITKRIDEPVPEGLAERIKQRIPSSLVHNRGPINIIVHLKISRLAAVAAIVITLAVCMAVFGGRGNSSASLYDDLKIMVRFLPGQGASQDQVKAGLYHFSLSLKKKGKDVVYYGDIVKRPNRDTLLMYWKLDNDTYRVIFGDLHVAQLTATQLLEAQSRMIKNLRH